MALRSAFPLSRRLIAQQNQLGLVSRGYATEPGAAATQSYVGYGAAGVGAVALLWYFTSGSKNPQTDTKAGSAAAKAGEAIQADGKVGKHFNPDGAVGSTAQAVGGPLDKDGAIGRQFKKDGAIGGLGQEAGEATEKKAKK
ncbi:hypothetical protein WJX73_002503 [Symbiochloris irregularis]|uniref:Uncharacterized protein n=1 Tax=Symbiochloris irregularis TaxID=706552 RepID=A0AAW1P2R7_9CHLO